ncbi:TetR/AcrR family transcriptional regulator [Streptomyces noursei]|uniref:TetR/AcrR family transcriptional regulator n=1 Tax=Streptomyces noursei TaxID=1971 RepID=UPI0036D28E3B
MDTQHDVSARPVGRRERNKQRVRQQLYTAALNLFAEQGFDRTSIDEIAERADVARGTFFNHFQRKEDLIAVWSNQRRERLLTSMQREEENLDGCHSGAVVRLQRCMTLLAKLNDEEHDATIPMITAWVKAGMPLQEEPYTAEIFTRIVTDGCQRGELAADATPLHLGYMLRDLYLGALYRWCQQQGANAAIDSLAEDLQASLRVLVRGIEAQPRSLS